MRFHVEQHAERLVREAGLGPAAARRRAALAFGGVEKYKEAGRDARGLGWVSGLALDFRLGARMLVKSPGLALVGGVALAVAIALGAAFFDLRAGLFAPLPLPEGERVVALEVWDAEVNNQERRILHDFGVWRAELRSVAELGAYRMVQRNRVAADGAAEPVVIAELTASGFRLAGVAPRLGRTLIEADEQAGAPAVVVIGHEVWRTHFDGDPAVIGRTLQLGEERHIIVGVMPEGFAFPVNFSYWTPLRAEVRAQEARTGPPVHVFGRLAPGATLDEARAELAAVGMRMAADLPETHARLRPRVVPYTLQFFDDMQGWEFPILQLFIVLLLVVICANVAILVYARTATRAGEIAVRSALGASRRRVIGQLFVEALVLSALAAAVGLGAARLGFRQLDTLLPPEVTRMLPFWMDFRLSSGTVLYVIGLTLLAAAVIGILPALKATGTQLEARLRQLGGGSGLQLGRTWTVLVVAQVALAVAALPAAVRFASEYSRYGLVRPGFAAEEYLTARLYLDPVSGAQTDAGGGGFRARYADRQAELVSRLQAEPAITAVTRALELPGAEPPVRVEVEGDVAPPEPGHAARFARVDLDFFQAFGVPLLAGRPLGAADLDSAATAVVVNRSFAEHALGGGNVLGRRVRYVEGYRSGGIVRTPYGVTIGRWYEIVGLVDDFPPHVMEPGASGARIYHALAPGDAYPLVLALRVRGEAAAGYAPRLRAMGAALDPTLRLDELRPLDEVLRQWQSGMRLAALALAFLTLSVLLLSAAGLYALMSFTVAQRRREIGIRVALGAHRGRILQSIFARAARQLVTGVVLGAIVAALLDVATGGELLLGGAGVILVPGVSLLMLAVGLVAAWGPARRGLRVQPSEALRAE